MRPGRLVLSVVGVEWSSNAGSTGAPRVTPDTISLSLHFARIGVDLACVPTLENPYSARSRAWPRLEAGRSSGLAGALDGGRSP
jgi:hypothetical protein